MLLYIYGSYLAIFTFITFFVYVNDKNKAKKGAWRTKEGTLLMLSLIGSGVGGYLAMLLARHKTRKWYFHFVNLIGIIWQVALLVYLFVNLV